MEQERVSVFERNGCRYMEVAGHSRVYLLNAGDEIVYCGRDWCLLVRDSRARRWAACRLVRLTGGVRVYHFGVDTKMWRSSGSACARKLEAEYPGILSWATHAATCWMRGKRVTNPPAIEGPARELKGPERVDPTKDEMRAVADVARERWDEGRAASQRRVTRPEFRYLGEIVEVKRGVPESIAHEAMLWLLQIGVFEDVVLCSRTKRRGLRVNEAAYKEYFDREATND